MDLSKKGGTWRIRKNNELWDIYKEPDVIALIGSKILRWLTYIQKGKKSARETYGQTKERMGRSVEKLSMLGARIEKAQDKRKWIGLVGKAKNQFVFKML